MSRMLFFLVAVDKCLAKEADGRYQSTADMVVGGTRVRWSRDGKELFYGEGETLVAVSVSSGSGFSVGSATRLFEHPGLGSGGSYPPYDVSADGQRFILAEPAGEAADAPEPSIRVVMNWFEEFRGREKD